jgi:arginase
MGPLLPAPGLRRRRCARAGNLEVKEVMTTKRAIRIVGAALGHGAQDRGCAAGPQALRSSALLPRLQADGLDAAWEVTLHAEAGSDALTAVRGVASRLAQRVESVAGRGAFPLVLGGDHSCAIGTWSAMARAMRARGALGLIWIDAHMDAHVPATSPSGALHGMPLAALLGYGEASLAGLAAAAPHARDSNGPEHPAALRPEHVCLVGVRSFETGEAELLARLGVRVFFMDEIRRRGLPAVMAQAQAIATRGTAGFGVTLDLDAIDPREAPGVGSPEPGGLRVVSLLRALAPIAADRRLGALEIVEYNPFRDPDGRTAAAAGTLAAGLLNPARSRSAEREAAEAA